jgi:hypothetical protein
VVAPACPYPVVLRAEARQHGALELLHSVDGLRAAARSGSSGSDELRAPALSARDGRAGSRRACLVAFGLEMRSFGSFRKAGPASPVGKYGGQIGALDLNRARMKRSKCSASSSLRAQHGRAKRSRVLRRMSDRVVDLVERKGRDGCRIETQQAGRPRLPSRRYGRPRGRSGRRHAPARDSQRAAASRARNRWPGCG